MAYFTSPHHELRLLATDIRAYVEALGVWGVQHTPLDQPPAPTLPVHRVMAMPDQPEPSPAARGTTDPTPPSPSSFVEQDLSLALEPPSTPLSRLSFAELETVAKQCTACRLHHGRTHVVFGVGNPCAELMFVGEA